MNEAVVTKQAPAAAQRWSLDKAQWAFLVRNPRSASEKGLCWWWRAIASNGARWEGDEIFPTRGQCEANAATHGYVQTPPQVAVGT